VIQRLPVICANEDCRKQTTNYYIVHYPPPTRYFCKDCHEKNVGRETRDNSSGRAPPRIDQ
jgi:hypothetical protein